MAGSKSGALRTAAKRIGISLEEYLRNVDTGLKWCFSCKDWKPIEDFSFDKSRGDGRKANCKACCSIKKLHILGPPSIKVQLQASSKVSYAVKTGTIPHISHQVCIDCGRQAEHYHHYRGYAPTDWLNVVPVCRSCHRRRHYEQAG